MKLTSTSNGMIEKLIRVFSEMNLMLFKNTHLDIFLIKHEMTVIFIDVDDRLWSLSPTPCNEHHCCLTILTSTDLKPVFYDDKFLLVSQLVPL